MKKYDSIEQAIDVFITFFETYPTETEIQKLYRLYRFDYKHYKNFQHWLIENYKFIS